MFNKKTVPELILKALNKSLAVIEFEPNGTIITANQNFLDAIGYTLAEIQGRHHSMFVDPADVNTSEYKLFWKNLADGKFAMAEYKRIAKGDREIWIQASYNPVINEKGVVLKVIKFASDTTQAKLLNAEFQGKINAISKAQAVIEFQLDGIIITANENFLGALDYTLDEIRGKHHSMFMNPAEAALPAYRTFWQELAQGKFQSGEYRRMGKGHKEIWIQASYNPIFDMSGKPFKVVK